MIYEGAPSRTLPAVATALRNALAAGKRCMYLNSRAMVAGVRSQLYASGTHVEREVARGALILSSEYDHLVDGRFVIDPMIDMLEGAVDQALADGYTGLFATGDMTWEFGPDKDFSKLLDYEWRLEQVFRKQPALSGICQYHRDLIPAQAVRDGVVSHGSIFINATLTQLNPHYVLGTTTERKKAASPELDLMLASLLAEVA